MNPHRALQVFLATVWHLLLICLPGLFRLTVGVLALIIIPGPLYLRIGIGAVPGLLILLRWNGRYEQLMDHSTNSKSRLTDVPVEFYRSPLYLYLQIGTSLALGVVCAAIGYCIVKDERWIASLCGAFCGVTMGVFLGGLVGNVWFYIIEINLKCRENNPTPPTESSSIVPTSMTPDQPA